MQNLINLTAEQIEEDFTELGGSIWLADGVVEDVIYTQDTLDQFETAAKGWADYRSLKRQTTVSGHAALVILGAQAKKGDTRRDIIVVDYVGVRAVNQ